MADLLSHDGVAAPQRSTQDKWTIRPYREGDISSIVALINAADPADKTTQLTTPDEMEASFAMPGSFPERQAVVVEGTSEGVPDGMLLGYGRIVCMDDEEGQERIHQFRVIAHPAAKKLGIEKAVFAALVEIARAHEQQPDTKPFSKVSLVTIPKEESTISAMLNELGMTQIRQAWTMERSLEEPLPEPAAVQGVTLRHYRKKDDHERAKTSYDNSFIDHFEFHPFPQEMWNYQMDRPEMRADLSWLAEVAEEPGTIAGFCICQVKPTEMEEGGNREGWIELLGTVRGWRGKGLGKSLLLHGMHSLKEAGVTTALLGVDSESLTGANRLYESVGFRIRSHEILYKQNLAEIKL